MGSYTRRSLRSVIPWLNVVGLSYQFVVQRLAYAQRYAHLARHAKKAKRALKKLNPIAGRQVRDLRRQLIKLGQEEMYAPMLQTMERIVRQQRGDKNKVYSLHAPEVSRIAKGKAHKKYAFGSKVSVASLSGSHVVVGITSFVGNPHDGKTLATALDEVARWTGQRYARGWYTKVIEVMVKWVVQR
jgi:transposase, IS5 family